MGEADFSWAGSWRKSWDTPWILSDKPWLKNPIYICLIHGGLNGKTMEDMVDFRITGRSRNWIQITKAMWQQDWTTWHESQQLLLSADWVFWRVLFDFNNRTRKGMSRISEETAAKVSSKRQGCRSLRISLRWGGHESPWMSVTLLGYQQLIEHGMSLYHEILKRSASDWLRQPSWPDFPMSDFKSSTWTSIPQILT